MNPSFGLAGHQLEELAIMSMIAMFLALVPLPAIVFGIARSWSRSQPQLGGAALAGAVTVVVVAILAIAFVTLALVGWLPPPTEWRRPA